MRIRRWLPGGCSSGRTGSDPGPSLGPGLRPIALKHRAKDRGPGAGPSQGGRARCALLGLGLAAGLATSGAGPARGGLGPGAPSAQPGVRPGPAPAPSPATWSQGVYIWDSRQLLDHTGLEPELRQLHQQGIDDLLVGLSPAQVEAGAATERALARLLERAHGRGMTVQLLLGDPSWIQPAHRPELLALVARYRPLPFDGLHLDLEVEQLGWPVPDQRLREWVDTLRAVQQASPWPVGMASHPRWFEPGPAGGDPFCLPCQLPPLRAISLMIYGPDLARSAARARTIARRWPGRHFRLAQSLEAGLSPRLNWPGTSSGQLQGQVRPWRHVLESAGLGGIDWQDWQSYPKGPRP